MAPNAASLPSTFATKVSRWRLRGPLVIVLGISLAVFAAACGGGGSEPDAGASGPADAVADSEPRLWLDQRGEKQPFENGDTATVDGMQVEIYVSPYPPARVANIDFYVTRGGAAIEDANVTVQYDMTVMDHGPFALLAAPTGRGHYLAPVDFIMSGDFWLNVAVSAGGTEEFVINLLVRTRR